MRQTSIEESHPPVLRQTSKTANERPRNFSGGYRGGYCLWTLSNSCSGKPVPDLVHPSYHPDLHRNIESEAPSTPKQSFKPLVPSNV